MLRKLSKMMGIIAEQETAFDPAMFNDVVATQTQWTPLKRGGTNFCTHKLVQKDLNRLDFRPTFGAILFSIVFMAMGMAAIAVAVVGTLLKSGEAEQGLWIPLLVGSVFVPVGAFMLHAFTKPIAFDSRNGYFWKGRKNPSEIANRSILKYCENLDNIHALQLISEFCSSKNSSYFSYELNLVLHSGERINVIDHGNRKKAVADSEKLAEFLGCPLWNAMER